MKALLMVLLVLALVACGPSAPPTAAEVATDFYNALYAQDKARAIELVTQESTEQLLLGMAIMANMDIRGKVLGVESASGGVVVLKIQTIMNSETIVEQKTIYLVQDKGKWKVDLTREE